MKERNSNIEILRILCIFMVLVLHFNSSMYGGGLVHTQNIASNQLVLRLLESLSIGAVNVFVLISGYFLCGTEKRKIGKAISLFIWVSVYQVLYYLLKVILVGEGFSLSIVIKTIVPKNYYVILYATLFLISPILNRLIKEVSRKYYVNMLLLLCILFSVYPSIMDIYLDISGENWVGVSTISLYGLEEGYTIINFILLYLIAGYIRRWGLFERERRINLVGYLVCSLIIFVISVFSDKVWNYNNIFVILESVFLFDMFRKINIKKSVVVNFLASSTFGVFLIHEYIMGMLCRLINVEKWCKSGIIEMILCVVTATVGVYIVSVIIDIIAGTVVKPIANLWKHTKLYSVDLIKEEY